MFSVTDLTKVSPVLDSRAITFENITGERGAGGKVAGGRKGMPQRIIKPGESVTIADVDGPATIRHIWMTFPGAPPQVMRALYLEVFYDDMPEPSISVPCLDFFGATLGRPTEMNTALTAIQEGRGFKDVSGPGRFLGCLAGIRCFEGQVWYGEGEVKTFATATPTTPRSVAPASRITSVPRGEWDRTSCSTPVRRSTSARPNAP